LHVYLVGGAVRDSLLDLDVAERDYVVVGATPQQLVHLGYIQVGKDFPVFLHPHTREEYALARTERKQGRGYTGFECYAAADVTLEQDLLRRDLTINAIAQAADGKLIDPYGGVADLNRRILRHVSPAFSEDPLRVLRVARFAARFHRLGFVIAAETQELMGQMSRSGELDALTPERVWKELEKVLSGDDPQVFFQVLRDCGALAVLFPEVDALFGVPAPAKWHPEIDTGIHTLLCMEQIACLSDSLPARFATLCHDFGKTLTPKELWPSHRGHGQKGLAVIRRFCERYRIPNDCRDLALLVSDLHGDIHRALELRPQTLLRKFDQMDVWRKPERLEWLLLACQADYQGRTGFQALPYPQREYVLKAFAAARDVAVKPIVAAGFKGAEIKEQLNHRRIRAIDHFKERYHQEQQA